MRGVWTWELEGGGKMLGVRIGSFFEKGREVVRRYGWRRLVERELLCDDGSVLESGQRFLGILGLVDVRTFLIGLRVFNKESRLFRTDDWLLWDDRKFLHATRLLPREGVNLRELVRLQPLGDLLGDPDDRRYLRCLIRLFHKSCRSRLRRMKGDHELAIATLTLQPRRKPQLVQRASLRVFVYRHLALLHCLCLSF